jgi:hypothetical protein
VREYRVYMNTAHIDLVGLREISARSGVGIDTVAIWATGGDFPEPEARLAVGKVWVWGPVHHWLHDHHHQTDSDLTFF